MCVKRMVQSLACGPRSERIGWIYLPAHWVGGRDYCSSSVTCVGLQGKLSCHLSSLLPLLHTPHVVRQVPLSVGLPGKRTRVGSHPLLQGIFPTQRLNPGLLPCRQIPYLLSHREALGVEDITEDKSASTYSGYRSSQNVSAITHLHREFFSGLDVLSSLQYDSS